MGVELENAGPQPAELLRNLGMTGKYEELTDSGEPFENLEATVAALTIPVNEHLIDEERKALATLVQLVDDRQAESEVRLFEGPGRYRWCQRHGARQARPHEVEEITPRRLIYDDSVVLPTR